MGRRPAGVARRFAPSTGGAGTERRPTRTRVLTWIARILTVFLARDAVSVNSSSSA
jgi:hypothetical protein